MRIAVELAPRPEYGRVHPVLERCDGGLRSRGGPLSLVLSTPVALEVDGSDAHGVLDLEAGDRAHFALRFRPAWRPAPDLWEADGIEERIGETIEAWNRWAELHQGYQGPWKELVHHSGRILQGLTYRPTGAIIAAPTTSLPETPGGARNWDYRYAWIRDASLTLEALWVAACPDEAHRFFDFLSVASLGRVRRGEPPQIMFGIGGEHELPEREVDRLDGWRGSRPVRVGNDAFDQVQLDVYGEIFGALARLRDQVEPDDRLREFLLALADQAADRWEQPDHGIWEIRNEPARYVHSALLCWVALDRALDMAGVLDPEEERIRRWRTERDRIRSAIEGPGWSDRLGAFRQVLGRDDLDAAALMIPIVGFLPGDDPRVVSTLDAIEDGLTDGNGLVYRYLREDGLPGDEGAFLLCTFWLAHAHALAGRTDRARATFERARSYVNDVGLLAEEVDPETGELLGNFPQAFSHVGLVTAAWAIHQAERGEAAVVGS